MIDLTDAFREVLNSLKIGYMEKGNRLEMRCPFHDDRTPSSGVYKSSAKFYCFTCDLTLDAAQFLARATGEGEDKAIMLLEDKFGVFTKPKDKVRGLRIVKELAKADTRLRELKGQGITRVGYGLASEVLDRVIYLFEGEAMDSEELDNILELWYNRDIQEWENIGAELNQSGAAGVDFDGRVTAGATEVFGDGEEALRPLVGGKGLDYASRASEADDDGGADVCLE